MTSHINHTSLVTLSSCNLNQWSLDFDGNMKRILKSCQIAKSHGSIYRLGSELEICGYGCEDHYYEIDTFIHCWESLEELLSLGATDGLICDFGMPILHNGIRYNCRIICHDRKILLIRPKISLADSGNYRESRYFTAYKPRKMNESFLLPTSFQNKFNQVNVPFGNYYIKTIDGITIGCESCEELWTPQSSHINLALNGVEIITNGSGSHHELRKLHTRLDLMINSTKKCGGIYMYSNQRGCDGSRLYYDGCCMIICNGQILAQGKQFDLSSDVEVVTATIDLNDIRSYRASIPSFGIQASNVNNDSNNINNDVSCLQCNDISMTNTTNNNTRSKLLLHPTRSIKLKYHIPEEECCLGPACWLWDYLRRSGSSGFFLPLSGGADSSSVATIVGCMCHLLMDAINKQDPIDGEIIVQLRRIVGKEYKEREDNGNNNNNDNNNDANNKPWIPSSSKDIANLILHTTFMGTDNSSEKTKNRAKLLGEAIGSYHTSITIDIIVNAVLTVFETLFGKTKRPKFMVHGGSKTEDLALQNIQARLRMVMSYLFAQLLPWVRGRKSGFLLVLGSSNVDESLRGYMTKYDCSSADLNPIGSICKDDLKSMLLWASNTYPTYSEILKEIASAPPTAELQPNDDKDNENAEHTQLDEEDMGMTYKELGIYGTLRKISRCGPVSMYRKLLVMWSSTELSPLDVANKVKKFFIYYSINRHKMCTITPSYHAEAYSPDDNRYDLRQFLYNVKWTRQFHIIDTICKQEQEQYEQEKQLEQEQNNNEMNKKDQ